MGINSLPMIKFGMRHVTCEHLSIFNECGWIYYFSLFLEINLYTYITKYMHVIYSTKNTKTTTTSLITCKLNAPLNSIVAFPFAIRYLFCHLPIKFLILKNYSVSNLPNVPWKNMNSNLLINPINIFKMNH